MAKKKVFFDLQFTGVHKLATPISIGLSAEDGRRYYAEFTDFDKYQINEFLKQKVLPKRVLEDFNFEKDYDPNAQTVLVKGDIDVINKTITEWFNHYQEDGVEMWGDLCAYDWVLFISIFGNGLDLPKHIDYIPMDLCTALKLMGEEKDVDRAVFAYGEELAKKNKENSYNALYEADTQLEVYKKLVSKATKIEEDASKEGETEDNVQEGFVDKHEQESENVPVSESKDESVEPPIKTITEESLEESEEVKEEVLVKSETTDSEFIEPTQEEINSTQEFDSPL